MATDKERPYVGPKPFERDDAPRFFGRERESRDLFSLVIAQSDIVLFSQSGAGKTSLINAGLIPLLETRKIEVLPVARVRPRLHEEIDTEEIANIYVFNVLADWTGGGDLQEFATMSLADFLKRREPKRGPDGEGQPRVIIFDQFEELFTSHLERARDRKNFFEQVRDAIEADGLLRVVFAMREDYIAELEPFADLLPDRLSTGYRLEQLRRDAAVDAVTGPLKDSEFSFASGVADRLVDELLKLKIVDATGKFRSNSGEYVEPVQLQVVCENLLRNLPKNVTEITEEHRRKYGDVDRALEEFYKSSLAETAHHAKVSQRRLRKWFGEVLITEGTRNAIRLGKSKTGGIPNRAVLKLEDLHVIHSEEKPGRGRWYELTHDRLIEPIQRANQAAHRRSMGRWIAIGLAGAAVLLVLSAIKFRDLQRENDVNARLASVNASIVSGYDELNAGKYDDALKSFQSAAQNDPNSYQAHFALGATYALRGDTDQSIAEYRKAAALDPTAPQPHLRIGDLLLQSDSLKAKDAYQEALEIDEKSSGAHFGLGDVYYMEEKFEDAAKEYETAGNLDPSSPESDLRLGETYLLNGNYQDATQRFSEAIEKVNARNESLGRAHVGLGHAYLDKANYDFALAEFNRAIGTDPQSIEAYDGIAQCYFSLGKFKSSIDEYRRAIDRFAKEGEPALLAQLHNGLGYSYLIQSKTHPEYLQNAEEELNKSLNFVGPQGYRDPFVVFNLGVVRAGQKKIEEAQSLFEEAWMNCPQTLLSARLEHAVFGTAINRPGSVEELQNVLQTEKPPPGLLDQARKDAKLLVDFNVNADQSKLLVKLFDDAMPAASPSEH